MNKVGTKKQQLFLEQHFGTVKFFIYLFLGSGVKTR